MKVCEKMYGYVSRYLKGNSLKKIFKCIGIGLCNGMKSIQSIFEIRKFNKTVNMNEELISLISRIRYIKDNLLDLIRIEDTGCTTKYGVLEYQQEVDGIRLAALNSLVTGTYSNKTQFLLINKILIESSELIDIISDLVLKNKTDINIKRACLVHVGQVI